MKNLLAALAVLAAVPAQAQTAAPGRYVIVAAPQGDAKGAHAVFKLDTLTGRVWYCTPRVHPDTQAGPAVLVQCVAEPK